MYYIKCYRQTTILKPNERQEPSEVNGQKTTKWNQNQKPKATSHKPSEAKWSQSQKPKTKNQKPKAKWARKWEILAPKCMQNTDFS